MLTGTATLPTTFLNLPPFKLSSINLSASSTIAWGQSRLRVALVLDNTGSMADSGKIGALADGDQEPAQSAQSVAVNTGDVYVSIIPFVKDVNVGSSYSGASWIDWTDWEANNGTCSRGNATTQSSCTTLHLDAGIAQHLERLHHRSRQFERRRARRITTRTSIRRSPG